MVLLGLTAPCNSRDSSLLLVEQLLYLAQGEAYLSELDLTLEEDRPDTPGCISRDLWRALHRIPLSTDYFSEVINSVHDHPAFWESLPAPESVAKYGDIPNFPWKGSVSESSSPDRGLDDYVLLNHMYPLTLRERLLVLTSQLISKVEVPELKEMIRVGSSQPLLLLYDEECPVSQCNVMELESQLKQCLPVSVTLMYQMFVFY